MSDESYFDVDSDPALAKRIRLERTKARDLRRTQWWKRQIAKGQCHYCKACILPILLSMDHIVPLARGGKSTKGNIVPACLECNKKKNLETPAEARLRDLASRKDSSSNPRETS
ncbi:MAG: HNH endonuclease [Nitrospirales bacterium]|nr:HNH endonuclease [Nitrospirales bacterium]